jgi:hypothetical protein
MKILHIGCQSTGGLTRSLKSSDALRGESFQERPAKEFACTFCAPCFRLKTTHLGFAGQWTRDKLSSTANTGANLDQRKGGIRRAPLTMRRSDGRRESLCNSRTRLPRTPHRETQDGSLLSVAPRYEKKVCCQLGQRVRIVRGPSTGLEGMVADSNKSLRLILSITLIQQSVLLEIG